MPASAIEPALVGRWGSDGDDGYWTCEKARGKAYDLTIVENEVPGEFEGHLSRLGGFLFLDLYPKETKIKNSLYKAHLIRTHTLLRIKIQEDSLQVAILEYDWLKEAIEMGEIEVACETLEDETFLLTASTQELQEFVVKFAEEAFSDFEQYERKR